MIRTRVGLGQGSPVAPGNLLPAHATALGDAPQVAIPSRQRGLFMEWMALGRMATRPGRAIKLAQRNRIVSRS